MGIREACKYHTSVAENRVGYIIMVLFYDVIGEKRWNRREGSVIHNRDKRQFAWGRIVAKKEVINIQKPIGFCKRDRLLYVLVHYLGSLIHRIRLRPVIREMTNSTTKMKKSTLAMEAAASTIPKNPKIPATRAIIRNSTDHFNMGIILSFIELGSEKCSSHCRV